MTVRELRELLSSSYVDQNAQVHFISDLKYLKPKGTQEIKNVEFVADIKKIVLTY